MACVKCNKGIISDEIHYNAAELGPELLLIIEQNIAHEIATDAALCEACFISVTNILESLSFTDTVMSNSVSKTYKTSECVWCLLSLSRWRKSYYLTSGPQRDVISNIISPRQIPDGGTICHQCWVRACRLVDEAASNSGQLQHICVWCKRSLSRRRTNSIPHSSERHENTAQVAPRQIFPGVRLCYTCWLATRRTDCIACSTSTVRRGTHLLLNGPERDVISKRIYPRQVSDHSMVCNDCWTWAQDAVHREYEQPVEDEPKEEEPPQVLNMGHHIEFNTYKKNYMSSSQDADRRENEKPVEAEPKEEEPPQVLNMPHHIELNTYKKNGMSSSQDADRRENEQHAEAEPKKEEPLQVLDMGHHIELNTMSSSQDADRRQNEQPVEAEPKEEEPPQVYDSPMSSRDPSPTNEETTPSTLRTKLPQKKPVLKNINSSLNAIARCLGHIKSEFEELNQTQNKILLRISSPSAKEPSAATSPIDIDMPMTSLDDIRNIENRLEEEEHKEKLINILSHFGGNTTGAITRRVLESVFTNSLAIDCNWTGKNNKISLKNLRLIKVIIAAVRRNKVAETATDAEITGAITDWFRFAKSRS